MPVFRPLHLILALIALAAIALPLAVIRLAPPAPRAVKVAAPHRIVAQTELPPVEPIEFQKLTPEDARSYNESIPFSAAPNPAARAFRFAGGADDLARATDCLAAAGYYEAGDDTVGQRAVVQVVLNRLRHPAFPKSICGVVFQGSDRSTGCQFTFACDGALARSPSDAAWRRARAVATAALRGAVYRPVGYATHYHTDWVVPYWSASLDKITEVHTHLFFRWTGWWGTPPAFNRGWAGSEAPVPKLAALSDAHRTGAALAEAAGALTQAAPFTGKLPIATREDQDAFLTPLDRSKANDFQSMALAACGERQYCRVMGWTDRTKVAVAFPLTPAQLAAMSFSYIRDRSYGLERTLWNCDEFKGRTPCMKREALRLPVVPADARTITPPPAVPTRGLAELDGIRRRPAPPDPIGNTVAPN